MFRRVKRVSVQVPELPPGSIIRRNGRDVELVQRRWGLEPVGLEQRPRKVLRSEGQRSDSHRCLIPASDFAFGHGADRVRFTLRGSDWFYFAGIWRPKTDLWPEAFAALTTEANPDVAPYHDRQMAVIPHEDRLLWLDHVVDEAELLRPLPAGSFEAHVAQQKRAAQGALGF